MTDSKKLRILQRMCWNTKQWLLPSGATNESGFPGENNFGHEEWNFQVSDCWNGYIFPYTYQVPEKKKIAQYGGKFDIGFFTRHQEKNVWFFVGIHHDVELVAPDEYAEIAKHFIEKKIFERRAIELSEASCKFKSHKKSLAEVSNAIENQYIKLKAPVKGVELFPQPIPISKPANHRFYSFMYVDEFPPITAENNQFRGSSALAEDGYYRATPEALKIIIPRHNILSNKFREWLESFGISARQEESFIDILFEHESKKHIAELKITYSTTTTKAIREAIGQLFEYNYYPGRNSNDEWLIVIDEAPSSSDIDYIRTLSKKLKIPLRVGWPKDDAFEFFPSWPLKTA